MARVQSSNKGKGSTSRRNDSPVVERPRSASPRPLRWLFPRSIDVRTEVGILIESGNLLPLPTLKDSITKPCSRDLLVYIYAASTSLGFQAVCTGDPDAERVEVTCTTVRTCPWKLHMRELETSEDWEALASVCEHSHPISSPLARPLALPRPVPVNGTATASTSKAVTPPSQKSRATKRKKEFSSTEFVDESDGSQKGSETEEQPQKKRARTVMASVEKEENVEEKDQVETNEEEWLSVDTMRARINALSESGPLDLPYDTGFSSTSKNEYRIRLSAACLQRNFNVAFRARATIQPLIYFCHQRGLGCKFCVTVNRQEIDGEMRWKADDDPKARIHSRHNVLTDPLVPAPGGNLFTNNGGSLKLRIIAMNEGDGSESESESDDDDATTTVAPTSAPPVKKQSTSSKPTPASLVSKSKSLSSLPAPTSHSDSLVNLAPAPLSSVRMVDILTSFLCVVSPSLAPKHASLLYATGITSKSELAHLLLFSLEGVTRYGEALLKGVGEQKMTKLEVARFKMGITKLQKELEE